jgi:hypothetical protein
MTYMPFFLVMAGPAEGRDPAIHVFLPATQDVDGRDVKLVLGPARGRTRGHGHDEKGYSKLCTLGGG